MAKKIITATGSEVIQRYLIERGFEVAEDIPYQDGVLEIIKKEFADVVIVSEDLVGEYDKYIFIEKIKEVDTKIKIIVIVGELEDNYKSFLYSKGVFHIFTDGKSLIEELICAINDEDYKTRELDFKPQNVLSIKQYGREKGNGFNRNLVPKFQRQQVISFIGVGSSGKTTVASCFAKILSQKTKARVLLVDFDIVNAGVNRFIGVKKEPENPGYILASDKNSSLNYLVDAIDKRILNANILERYIVKSKIFPNLDVLTGNRSLYVCKNILSSEYYSRILEVAKTVYDYIILDTSGNIFLDSMQFALLNSTKVFVVTEGNYLALERTGRLFYEFFPVWGVPKNKVEIIINKYGIKSLDKIIINEIIKECEIAGYIKFSEKYEELINSLNTKLTLEIEEQYYPILEKLELIDKTMYKKRVNKINKRFHDKIQK